MPLTVSSKIRRTLKSALTSTLVLTTCLEVSCSQPPDTSSDPSGINNRPQNFDRFTAVLKLQEPALLHSAVRRDGRLVVDVAAREALLAEQNRLIAELENESSEIKILQRYHFVLNGIAVLAPKRMEKRFRQLGGVSLVEAAGVFDRPHSVEVAAGLTPDSQALEEKNSVSFIGAKKIRDELKVKDASGTEVPVDGAGIRVGVIDTGIDYTHAMFGGAGTPAAYKEVNPVLVAEGTFPTAKIVGGIDLVGTTYNAASAKYDDQVPRPDRNPIDEAGHGTHVAGTIAGRGDGVHTYTGVAPGAALHAIKVFGKDGSTSTSVILAALDYAVDPNGDLDPADALDVLNLSLGSGYGTPQVLYSEAIAALARGGIVTVASAGNSGDSSYIVGAPSTAPEAISVAASVDDMEHNWRFRAVTFATPTHANLVAEAIESAISKPIQDAGDVRGKLVDIGLAAVDLDAAQKAALAGNVALIDRGQVTFEEKMKRAEAAGAIGIVVANNRDGEPLSMGGDGKIGIPAIMITKTLGETLRQGLALGTGDVTIQFFTDIKIDKPALIDTIASFSSKGPRSVDGFIKPEISAPGQNILSAKMGDGAGGVKLSGTSMAAPHMAGVVALLQQYRGHLAPARIKSLITGTAKTMTEKGNEPESPRFSVSRQGAGRVQAFAAATAQLVVEPASLSLGESLVETRKTLRTQFALTNASAETVTLKLVSEVSTGLTLQLPERLTLNSGESKAINLLVTLAAPQRDVASAELDGFVKFVDADNKEVLRLPVLAVVKKVTRVEAASLRIMASSEADSAGAAGELTLVNKGSVDGEAMAFNLLGRDERKPVSDPLRGKLCDLESVGYRVIRKMVDGVSKDLLQIAVKLFNPVTTWNLCEVSVQVDSDGDGKAEQELLGTDPNQYVPTLPAGSLQSLLMDAAAMRRLRAAYEKNYPKAVEDYTAAATDLQPARMFAGGTLAVLTADLAVLKKNGAGDLKVKIGILANEASLPEADDFLGRGDLDWVTVPLRSEAQAFVGLEESIAVKAGDTVVSPLSRGEGKGSLVVYLPTNASTKSDLTPDSQAKIMRARYEGDH